MLSKKHVLHSGKRILICLLLWMLMLHTACAEVAAPTPTVETSAAAEPTAVVLPADSAEPTLDASDAVQEDGTQLLIGPILMVTDYSIVEGDTVPGSSFVLQMNIANLSEHASAYNVLATLTIENVSASLQEGATNQRYFHEIPPLQSVNVQFPLEVYSYCVEENMILSMTMSCYDAAAVHFDFQTMMMPSVDVARTLQIITLTVPQFVHRNSSMIITASLANAEPVALTNIKMHVVTQHGEQVTEVGQMLNGESKTVNCMYRFPEQQTETVQVYFTYESLYGHKYATDVQTFEVVVYDPVADDSFEVSGTLGMRQIMERLVQGIDVPGTDMQLPVPVIVLILIGFAGYGVIMYRVFRRKRW